MNQRGLGTRFVCQVGLIVRDIHRSIETYCEVFGMPKPNVTVTGPLDVAKTTYRGKPTKAQAKLAFFDMGQVSLELIEPFGGPSTWQEFLDQQGEGVHHIAFRIKGTDEVTAYLEEKGIDVIQQGHYTGGMYTYTDSAPTLGVILELLEDFDTSAKD